MGDRRSERPKQKHAPVPPAEVQHTSWVRWLSAMPAWAYLLAVVLAAGLLVAFSAWLDEDTRALAANLAFAGLLVWWTVKVRREWHDSEMVERCVGVLGCLLLLGASSANLVRYLLLR